MTVTQWLVLSALVVGLALAACTTPPASTATHVPPTMTAEAMMQSTPDGIMSATPETTMAKPDDTMMGDKPGGMMMAQDLKLVSGWYKDREVRYYDFGMQTPLNEAGAPAIAPIYVLVYGMNADGSPNLVPGQHNIVDVKPGDNGYSDLWQVMLVTVPQNYVADAIKSKADLAAAGYPVKPTAMLVNCPIIHEGTTLEGGEKLTQGWYKGDKVFYPDFGPNPQTAAPIWAFITGMDAQGNPQFVEGQRNVIDVVPGDTGYSAFWQVNLVMVPSEYVANDIKSADEVHTSGYKVTATTLLVNCPVTYVQPK